MKELHTIKWYMSHISPHLPKEAFKTVPSRLFGGLAYLIVIISGVLAIALSDLNLWVNLLIAAILGSSYAAMGFLGHEILHGSVVKKPWVRDFLGALAFWPLSTGPKLWQRWHNMTHHAHTQDAELDPDAWPEIERLFKSSFLRMIYRLPFFFRAFVDFISLAITFSLHSFRMFVCYIKEGKSSRRAILWAQFILPWVSWITLLFVIGVEKWIFAYLLPLLIANLIVMGYISTNHRLNPLVEINDPLANCLTVTVPRWVDALHFNFSYHTEHHLYPGMNPKYYPLVKEYIKKFWPERYHEMSLVKALITLYKTPRVYYDKTELIDPHKGKICGSLGNGLDPDNIRYRKVLNSQIE
jgi:fatty acid desaturase